MLLSVYETELEADESLSHVFTIGPIIAIFHHSVKGITSDETSSQGLDLNRN